MSKLTEDAVALLRDMGAPLEHPRVRGAIASALEELATPPPAEKEDPGLLSELLEEIERLRLAWRSEPRPEGAGQFVECLDRLIGMADRRDGRLRLGRPLAEKRGEAGRAEEAESRMSELESKLEAIKRSHELVTPALAARERELESARARVGVLERERDAAKALLTAPQLRALAEKEPSAPTPASTFAAVADALPTNAEDERVVDELVARRPVVTRPLASAPTPAVVESPPCAHACPVCFKEPKIMSVTYANGCEQHQESIAPDVAKAKKVAPPGLTPEEAEAGARRMYEAQTTNGPWIQWEDLQDETRDVMIADYRFAHSEGAQAAKAKGGKVAERVRAASERAVWLVGQLGGTVAFNVLGLARELEALAAELESTSGR